MGRRTVGSLLISEERARGPGACCRQGLPTSRSVYAAKRRGQPRYGASNSFIKMQAAGEQRGRGEDRHTPVFA